MRTILAFLILCSSVHAQLAAPLDDAVCLFRAQNAAPVPNEGTRHETLSLTNVTFNADATIGDHWTFGATSTGVCPVPPSVLNGSVTFAIRYRTTALWSDRALLMVVDPTTPNITKHFFLHQTSGNKYMSRFWAAPPVFSQIPVTSSTSVNTGRTDTIVTTWNAADNTNRIYVNGTLESLYTINTPRSAAVASGLDVPYTEVSTWTPPAGYVFAIGQWSRALTAEENTVLPTLADWLAGGGGSAPPPPTGPVIKINGAVQPNATAKVNGVTVDNTATVEIEIP